MRTRYKFIKKKEYPVIPKTYINNNLKKFQEKYKKYYNFIYVLQL